MNSSTKPFSAVVLAADRAHGDPVAQAAGVRCKAFTPIKGTPMVLRVLTALDAAQEVESCVLCGPPWSAVEKCAELHSLIESGHVRWVRPEATPSSSAYAAMQSIPKECPVLVTTADHALLSSKTVDYFCAEARAKACDVAVGLVPYQLVATAYPGTRRTVWSLQDGAYCTCNLFVFLTPNGRTAAEFWRQVEGHRKKPFRLMGAIGWTLIGRYLVGRLSLAKGLAEVSRRLGLKIEAIEIPFPEAALDVDTVSDWEFVEAVIAQPLP